MEHERKDQLTSGRIYTKRKEINDKRENMQ